MNDTSNVISNEDRDSLFSLPLSMLPLETRGLNTARIIKNARLDTVAEVFQGKRTGSGQLAIVDLPLEFDLSEGEEHSDMRILRKIEALHSYDVYSLRISLRELGIDIRDVYSLHLSEEKEKELTSYMTSFTRPLIKEIYGDSMTSEIRDFEDILALFRHPDVKKALQRLKEMADKLDIRPDEVPAFLEDYGDIFLSLSYYRQCLDQIEPIASGFLESQEGLRKSYQFRDDRSLQDVSRKMESVINEALSGLTGRFEAFDRASKNLWRDISAEHFHKVEKLIRTFHTTNGGVLCSLWVKMSAWDKAFPNPEAGSPARRAEFILTELRHGIDKIRKLERSAPKHVII